jgi:hypothetical protein
VVSLVNISIDPPDILTNLDHDMELEEDLSINEMESISELILEKYFNLTDAVPENDDSESENLIKKIDIPHELVNSLALIDISGLHLIHIHSYFNSQLRSLAPSPLDHPPSFC